MPFAAHRNEHSTIRTGFGTARSVGEKARGFNFYLKCHLVEEIDALCSGSVYCLPKTCCPNLLGERATDDLQSQTTAVSQHNILFSEWRPRNIVHDLGSPILQNKEVGQREGMVTER